MKNPQFNETELVENSQSTSDPVQALIKRNLKVSLMDILKKLVRKT